MHYYNVVECKTEITSSVGKKFSEETFDEFNELNLDKQGWEFFHQPFERHTPFVIMGAQLKDPLKCLGNILLRCLRGLAEPPDAERP